MITKNKELYYSLSGQVTSMNNGLYFGLWILLIKNLEKFTLEGRQRMIMFALFLRVEL